MQDAKHPDDIKAEFPRVALKSMLVLCSCMLRACMCVRARVSNVAIYAGPTSIVVFLGVRVVLNARAAANAAGPTVHAGEYLPQVRNMNGCILPCKNYALLHEDYFLIL